MKRALCIVNQDTDLKPIFARMRARKDELIAEAKALQRRMDELKKQHDEEAKPIWDEVKLVLAKKEMLPEEFSDSRHHFNYERETGVLFMVDDEDSDEDGKPDIGKLMKMLAKKS